jgi:hypothetical protein
MFSTFATLTTIFGSASRVSTKKIKTKHVVFSTCTQEWQVFRTGASLNTLQLLFAHSVEIFLENYFSNDEQQKSPNLLKKLQFVNFLLISHRGASRVRRVTLSFIIVDFDSNATHLTSQLIIDGLINNLLSPFRSFTFNYPTCRITSILRTRIGDIGYCQKKIAA